jgi:hypothetical protein
MIKVFRKIRQKLLSENKASKYFLYALGEIGLVVIGILIALQINNWNDQRIEDNIETQILEELNKGLLIDRDRMVNELDIIHHDIKRLNKLDALLEDTNYKYTPYLDTLFGAGYGVRMIKLNKALYEDIKAVGLRILKDENIRFSVINLFEDNYASIHQLFDIETHVNELSRPYFLHNFHNIQFHVASTPNDFNKVWTDPYYRNIVQYRIKNLESNHRRNYLRTVDDINLLSGLIEEYLKD